MKFSYNIKKDVQTVLEAKQIDIKTFCNFSKISKRTLFYSFKTIPSNTTLEKIYNSIYDLGFRLNKTKSEIFNELYNQNDCITLYHGSKFGVNKFTINGSRETNDFGKRLYLSLILDSTISFVDSYPQSCVYAFRLDLKDLNIYEFNCDLDWMIAVSYFRNKIKLYEKKLYVKKIISKIENSDIVIAPIADNKMFEILNQFAGGLLSTDQALHSLSASRLGKQYVIVSNKALKKLKFIERLFLCEKEKEKSKKESYERSFLIQSKLDFAKRKFRNKGKFIDEVLK